VSIAIDGERVENGYEGFYFPDLDVAVDVPAEHRAQFSGWVVNGRLVSDAPSLTFRADRPTVIQALFGDAAPTAAPPEESRAPARAPARLPQVEWRTIPAGSFWMGCVPGDPRCGREENPRHQVTIDEPFEMMAREAAADEYRAFAAATGAAMPRQPTWRSNARHPVVNVTWDEAQAFCGAVGGRLPGEAEWEYAARGGLDGRLFPWGDEFDGHGNGRRRGGADRWLHSAPVGSFVPNAFGLRDMAGNVWEWTASRYTPTLDAEPADEGYELRTVRGGSFDSDPPRLRASARVGLWREGRHNPYVGFRCLRSPALGS
jgi:formylglycine-generating enzyme required for sulfatase activity